jgi:cell division protease FtsH
MTDDEKQLVAVHEAGHALLSILLRGVKPPSRVSIVSRPGAFQRSPWFSADDREVVTKRELMAQLIVLLGGRAAEMNVFGQPSTRSEDDLENAASLARRMVERLAMTGRFELAGHGDDPKRPPPDDNHGGKEVRELLLRAEQAARTILHDNSDDLQRIADELSERETLTAAEVQALTRRSARADLDDESSGPMGIEA